ncbi:uncharacterized protein MYCGRDRAFT_96363 [Zymoseptoria tritici IPO323]|uniref:Uncharacterized protein n=1 Tax=Zymoseptoria tritici (strain CBS 115943 / IPO323) TaxID=336722 RepID=F9XLW1_ZYMTI|nr:uncharacterized protein MYCGRDRAFT_96363 [Zymoseptoria tritici IPO323]EGP84023.1 hypothetical protein MYCGRDRAFT_96363 [Zymoseptoria tritici IPO323]
MAPTTPKVRRSTRVQEAPALKKQKEEEEALKLASPPPSTIKSKSVKSKTTPKAKSTTTPKTKVLKSKPTPKPKTKFVGYPTINDVKFSDPPNGRTKPMPKFWTNADASAGIDAGYYWKNAIGEVYLAMDCLNGVCRKLEEVNDGHKGNQGLYQARDLLREWRDWTIKDDTFTHPLAPKSTLPTDNSVTHEPSQPATPKKMFPYLYPPLEPDYEPKWQPMWGTWPTAPKQGPKACTFDKYYYFSFLGDAPRAQRALESLCKTLEESGFGGDVEKANKPLFDARDVLREWTEWRDSIPPDEYSY